MGIADFVAQNFKSPNLADSFTQGVNARKSMLELQQIKDQLAREQAVREAWKGAFTTPEGGTPIAGTLDMKTVLEKARSSIAPIDPQQYMNLQKLEQDIANAERIRAQKDRELELEDRRLGIQEKNFNSLAEYRAALAKAQRAGGRGGAQAQLFLLKKAELDRQLQQGEIDEEAYFLNMRRLVGVEAKGGGGNEMSSARTAYETMYPKSMFGERVPGAPDYESFLEKEWPRVKGRFSPKGSTGTWGDQEQPSLYQGKAPPKEYPDAQWDEQRKAWIVTRNGKRYAISE